jgi:hypothetical protein
MGVCEPSLGRHVVGGTAERYDTAGRLVGRDWICQCGRTGGSSMEPVGGRRPLPAVWADQAAQDDRETVQMAAVSVIDGPRHVAPDDRLEPWWTQENKVVGARVRGSHRPGRVRARNARVLLVQLWLRLWVWLVVAAALATALAAVAAAAVLYGTDI